MCSHSVIRTLAEEEKGKIVSVAVRPGKVDTDVSFLFVLRLIRGLFWSSQEYRCKGHFASLVDYTWQMTFTKASYERREKDGF